MDKTPAIKSENGLVVDLWNETTARTAHLAQTTKIVVVRVYNLAVATLLYTASVATLFQFASLNEKYEVFLWEGRNSGELRAHAWGILSPNAAEVILEGKEDEVIKDKPVEDKSESKNESKTEQDVKSDWLGSVKKGAAWLAASSAVTYLALNCIQFRGVFTAPEVNILPSAILPSALGGVESSSSYLYPALLAGVPLAIVGYRTIQKIRECNIRQNAVRAVDNVWNSVSTSICSTAVSVAKCTTIAGAILWAANSLPAVHWVIADSWWAFALETAVTAALVPTVQNYSSKVLKTITSVLNPTSVAGASLVSALGLGVLSSFSGPHLLVANSWTGFAVESAVIGTVGLAGWAYTKPVATVKKHAYNFSADCLLIGTVAFAALEALTMVGFGSHMNSFWLAAEAAVPLALARKLRFYWKNRGVQAKKVAEQVAVNTLKAQVYNRALAKAISSPRALHLALINRKLTKAAIEQVNNATRKAIADSAKAQPKPTAKVIEAAELSAKLATANVEAASVDRGLSKLVSLAVNAVKSASFPTLVAALAGIDENEDKAEALQRVLAPPDRVVVLETDLFASNTLSARVLNKAYAAAQNQKGAFTAALAAAKLDGKVQAQKALANAKALVKADKVNEELAVKQLNAATSNLDLLASDPKDVEVQAAAKAVQKADLVTLVAALAAIDENEDKAEAMAAILA